MNLSNPLLLCAEYLLPDHNIVAGPGIKKGARLTVPAPPKRLFAGNISNTDCALDNPGAFSFSLRLAATNEPLAFAPLGGGVQAVYTSITPAAPAYWRHSDWLGSSRISSTPAQAVYYDGAYAPQLKLLSRAAEWKTIAPIEKGVRWGDIQFVNADTLLISGGQWKLVQTSGKVAFSGGSSFDGGKAISSAGGLRFVVPFFKLTGRVAALDVGGHGELKTISVYDAPFSERSYRLEVKGPKIEQLALLALSPDGSKLAVLYDEMLYVFQLPPAPDTASSSKSERP